MNRPYGEERVRRAKGRRGGDGPADYGAEGMSLGICLGLCLEISFGDNSGMGLALGMLIGLAAGTGIRKTAYDEEREEEVRSGSAASGLRKQTMPDPAKPVPSFGKPV